MPPTIVKKFQSNALGRVTLACSERYISRKCHPLLIRIGIIHRGSLALIGGPDTFCFDFFTPDWERRRFLIPAAGAGRDWSDSARFLGRSVRAEAGLQRQLQDRLSWDEEPPISAARQELLHAKAGGGGGETGRNRRRSAVRRASGSLGQPTRTDRGFDPSSLAMTAYLPPWSSSLSSLPPSSSSRAASTSLVVSGNASVAGTLQGDGGSRGTCGAVSQPATRRGARWRLEAHKLESTRHGGGEEHGASAEAGRAGESGDSGGGTGADSGASPARNSPLR